eukprot:556549_1
MATANGIGFLIYFILELHLSLYWIKTFQIYKAFQSLKCNAIPFSIWNRCILITIPLMAGIDNLRYFFGSLLSKDQYMRQSSQNLLHTVSFMHLVLLSYFIISCYFFAITPNVQSINEMNTTNIDQTSKDLNIVTAYNNSLKTNICWIFVLILTLIFFILGIYTFSVSRNGIEFSTDFGIHNWHSDHNYLDNANIAVQIGFQIPVVVTIVTLAMNISIWCKYKYWIPFVLTLITAIAMGGLASGWKNGFFFAANFFEYVLFMQYYLVDRFLFYVGNAATQENIEEIGSINSDV